MIGKGGHSETLLLLALFTRALLHADKLGGGGVVAHGILVSALGPHFGLGLGLGPGLDNILENTGPYGYDYKGYVKRI